MSEPPSKISIVSSPSPISGDVPAVAGPSTSSEAASTAFGASAPISVSSPSHISRDVPAVAGPSASSEAVPAAVGASTPTGATLVVCKTAFCLKVDFVEVILPLMLSFGWNPPYMKLLHRRNITSPSFLILRKLMIPHGDLVY